MNELIHFNEETETVLVENLDMLCPNGFPVAVEYTYEDWYSKYEWSEDEQTWVEISE